MSSYASLDTRAASVEGRKGDAGKDSGARGYSLWKLPLGQLPKPGRRDFGLTPRPKRTPVPAPYILPGTASLGIRPIL